MKETVMDTRETFRYVQMKFPGTSRWYTYRCDFVVKPGDILQVPTCYGPKIATVMESSADEDNGYPTAKWAKCFEDGHRSCEGWPCHFRVRHEDDPDFVWYSNQTRRCRPGQKPSRNHDQVEFTLPTGRRLVYQDLIGAADLSELEARIASTLSLSSHVMWPGQQAGKTATIAALMQGYGMGDSKMIEQLEERRDALKDELTEVENAIDEARAHERLREVEAKLDRERDAAEYRKKFDGIEVDDGLVEEAIRLRDRLKYGPDEEGDDVPTPASS